MSCRWSPEAILSYYERLKLMVAVVFNILLFVSCGFALFRGGKPERIGALLLATAAILSGIVVQWDQAYRHTEWGVFAIDLALLLGLLILALKANRYWPLWLTSFQLVTIWSHLAVGMFATTMPLAYAIASMAWSYPMLIMLAFAARRHHQRRVQFGADPSWSS
jgi:hypothetical protein